MVVPLSALKHGRETVMSEAEHLFRYVDDVSFAYRRVVSKALAHFAKINGGAVPSAGGISPHHLNALFMREAAQTACDEQSLIDAK